MWNNLSNDVYQGSLVASARALPAGSSPVDPGGEAAAANVIAAQSAKGSR